MLLSSMNYNKNNMGNQLIKAKIKKSYSTTKHKKRLIHQINLFFTVFNTFFFSDTVNFCRMFC